MEIRLPPELAELIKRDLQRGSCVTVAEFVEHAVFQPHEQLAWLAENRQERRDVLGDERSRKW